MHSATENVAMITLLLGVVLCGAISKPLANATDSRVLAPRDEYCFAVISDMHIGLTPKTTRLAKEAVAAINSEVAKREGTTQPIRFVFILGDITNNAQWEQYESARAILDALTVPYFPIFGNHDVWDYTRPTSMTSWEETVPTGDQRFKKTFEDIFREHHIEYDFTTRIHPATGHNVTYINFEMQLPSLSPNDPTLVLYGLDYVTRHAATNPRDNYKGAGPTADLHKWEHGTFSWLTRHVDRLRRDAVGHVVFMHHHTYSSTPFFIPDYFSMNQTDRVAVKEMIEESPLDISQFWGALVGHMHFWDTQPSLFSTFTQWENSATMSEGANAISLVSIRKGRVHIVERCCGILSPEVEIAVEIAFSLGVAFLQVLVFFFIAKYVQHAQLFSVSPELNIMTGLSESDADLPENSLLSASIFSFATLRSGVGSGVGGESASWFSGRKGWTWIVAVLCMLLSVAIPLIPLNEPQILLGVTASYLNDALLGALAIPLTLLMSLVFGVALKTKLGYVVLGVVWVAVSVLDYLRFFLRSSWTHNEHSYGEFWGPGLIAVLAVLFICFAYVTLRMRKSALELSTVPSFSLSRFLLSIFFMTLPGLTLVLGMAIVPAVIFRILLPIHWGEFYAFTVILVVTLILSVGGTLFFIHQALRILHPVNAVTGCYTTVTIASLAYQFVRAPDLPVPTYLLVVYAALTLSLTLGLPLRFSLLVRLPSAATIAFGMLGLLSYADYRAKRKHTERHTYDAL